MSFAGGLGFIIIAVAVLFVIFLFVVLYRLAYQQNANRALRDGHSTRLIEPIPFLQIIALGVLLILGFTTYGVIQSMETRLLDLQAELRTTKNQVFSMASLVAELQAELDAANRLSAWVQSSSVTLVNVDAAANEAVFRVIATLKDLPADATVYFVASNADEVLDVVQTEVTSLSLRFDALMTVALDGSYDFDIYMESLSGNQQAQLDQIDIPKLLDDMIRVDVGGHGNSEASTWNVDVRIDAFALDAFNISSVLIRVYRGETLLDSSDIFGDGVVVDDLYWVVFFEYSTSDSPEEELGFEVVVTSDLGVQTIQRRP
jgi:hypothetical protein